MKSISSLLLPALCALCVALAGCATSSTPPAAQAPARAQIGYRDLDRACARLVVELLTDQKWADFSRQYAQRMREIDAAATPEECVPLMFLSEVKNGQTTRAGRLVHAGYLTGKFKELTGSPQRLREFMEELPAKFPQEQELYTRRAGAWDPDAHPLPCIRWSAYIGEDTERAIQAGTFICNDPRVKQEGVTQGNILPPGLAFSLTMTQNTLDDTRFIFIARIVDFLTTAGTTGNAVVLWERQVSLPE